MKPVIIILSICLAVSVIANVAFVLSDGPKKSPANVDTTTPPSEELLENQPDKKYSASERLDRAEWLKDEIQMRKRSLADLDVIRVTALKDGAANTVKMIDAVKRAKAAQIEVYNMEQRELVQKKPSYSPDSLKARKKREDMLKKARSERPPRPISAPKPAMTPKPAN